MRYDAFISYRHTPLDMYYAKKVHTFLETYHVPAAVAKKTGKKKIERVFRDQEELPIGGDLTDKILDALKESEYLIVICSTETPGSYWVNKEIESFIELHGRDRILAFMIDGEPSTSFPKALVADENGKLFEPLAADIRGTDKKERNKKFKTEILRVAAPVIGCSYDDLRQRHRERVMKRNIIALLSSALVIGALGLGFGIYNAKIAEKMEKLAQSESALAAEKTALAEEKTQLAEEISEQFRQNQISQSRFYAEEALSVLETGNREDATLIALAALPSDENDRPYVADAEYALSETLHAYGYGGELEKDRVLTHKNTVSEIMLSDDTTRLISYDGSDNVYIWDTSTWGLIAVIPPISPIDESIYPVLDVKTAGDGFWIVTASYLYKYSYDGTFLFGTEITGCDSAKYNPNTDRFYAFSYTGIYVIDNSTGEVITIFSSDDVFSMDIVISPDYSSIASNYRAAEDDGKAELVVVDTATLESKQIPLSKAYVFNLCYADENHVCTVSVNGDFYFNGYHMVLDYVDINTSTVLWSKEIDANIADVSNTSVLVDVCSFETEDGKAKSDVIVIIGDEAFSYDSANGEEVAYMALPGYANEILVNQNRPTAYVAYNTGNIDDIDFDEGRILSEKTISTGLNIRDIVSGNGNVIIRQFMSSEVVVMKYHNAPDLVEITNNGASVYCGYVSRDGKYFVAEDRNQYNVYYLMDYEGNLISTYNGFEEACKDYVFNEHNLIFIGYSTIYTIDCETGEEKSYSLNDLGIERDYDWAIMTLDTTDNGKYCCLWNDNCYYAVDLTEFKVIYTGKTEEEIAQACVSDDGKYVFVVAEGEKPKRIEISSGKETVYDEPALIQNRHDAYLYGIEIVDLAPDNSSFTMTCLDGMLRVVDAETGEVTDSFSLIVSNRLFMKYTSDGRYLIAQGDDFRLLIYDLVEKRIVNTVDLGLTIRFMTEDANGRLALCDGYNSYLLETEAMGIVAAVKKGIVYSTYDQSFIIYYLGGLYKTYYKDYKALIKEAAVQFPNAVLDEVKKVKYNIS